LFVKLIQGLTCPRCSKKGHAIKVTQKFLKLLDLHYYECQYCEAKWYDSDEVVGLIAIINERIGIKNDEKKT